MSLIKKLFNLFRAPPKPAETVTVTLPSRIFMSTVNNPNNWNTAAGGVLTDQVDAAIKVPCIKGADEWWIEEYEDGEYRFLLARAHGNVFYHLLDDNNYSEAVKRIEDCIFRRLH